MGTMRANELETYPLSPMQQGLLFHHLASAHSGVDLEQIVFSLREDLDLAAFGRAWEQVAARHEVLRTAFRWEGIDEPVQEVRPAAAIPIAVHEWRGLAAAERRARLDEFLAHDRQRGFDLREAPLSRVAVFRAPDGAVEVVWSFPHIILDGRSFPIVLGELFDGYDANRRGESLELAPPPRFRDHVAWLAQQDRAAAEGFWRERLAGFASPTAFPGPPALELAPERGHRELRVSRETTAALTRLAERGGFSLATVVQGALALVLGRYAGEREVVFGATRACRRSGSPGAERAVGVLINTLPVRVALEPDRPAAEWLRELWLRERAATPHEHAPLVDVQSWSEVQPGSALFRCLLVFDRASIGAEMRARGGAFERRDFRLVERTSYPLTLYAYGEPELWLRLAYDSPPLDAGAAERMLGHLETALAAIAADPERRISQLPILRADEERWLLRVASGERTEAPAPGCVHHAIEAQARATPDAVALVFRDRELSYRELDARADRLAHRLVRLGVGPETRVAVCLERSLELPVTLLAIHKAGGAYVPLDPHYPAERLAFMLEDSGAAVLVTEQKLAPRLPADRVRTLRLDADAAAIASEPASRCDGGAEGSNLAYLIYTSGSTGRPKGVLVEHRSVLNFFAGMDRWLRGERPGTWLAVTSLCFDISVLELLWTLARGFRVVVSEDEHRSASAAPAPRAGRAARPLELSLFYFASAERGAGDKYRLLLEGAKFADAHGFAAVWTPERHFHAFGGLYPNPAVASAAIAAVTSRVGIRAGSVVLPLHHPARVAEEWALVDNLSHGRVGISFASGWQPNDFVLRPEAYASAREQIYAGIETVRRLWRGEAVEFPGPNGEPVATRTLPRPLQPELPVWVTAAGSAETYRRAGEIGANVLTHLLGQSLEELAERIESYRKARAARGLDPEAGRVTLMLHTFVGDDAEAVRRTVRGPMIEYLGSSLGLIKGFAAAWTAFKRRSDGTTHADLDLATLAPEELEGLLEYSFERYFESSALFGTPESCAEMLGRLHAIGVDEVACLVDFGVETDVALAHLPHLVRAHELALRAGASAAGDSIAELIRRHRVTHLQCTPSLAALLVADPDARAALGSVATLCVGGEAFPAALAADLFRAGCREVWNLYGPTETTIWSSIERVEAGADPIPLGEPIANTELHVLDAALRPVPIGVPGELAIGGRGVARGYWKRPELTAERFVPDPFRAEAGARLYRTGDLVRRRADGAIEFLGRMDQQVKIRGHRVELGEIEAALGRHPTVREAVVVLREDDPGEPRLVAYLIAQPGRAIVAAELRRFLREALPEFMIPSHFVALARFPQTPNRKLDRKALPPPGEAPAAAPRAGAANEVEERIARIWREVLRVAEVGREDNFFDLGGHSLLAVKVHRQLVEAFAREIAITDLFRFPTVRALAEHLSDASASPGLEHSAERGALRRRALAERRARLASREGARREDAG
jgi:natural product biosynthesis luciferase-like monooxygenase protein